MVSDLREALQDVVAPDLKAVVRGLGDLKEEMRSSIGQLRDEVHAGNAALREDIRAMDQRLREEIAQLRSQIEGNAAAQREDTRQHIALLREEMRTYESRSIERMAHLQDAIKLELVTRRNAELEEQMKQLRNAQQPQQH
jgi:hypothetical protein